MDYVFFAGGIIGWSLIIVACAYILYHKSKNKTPKELVVGVGAAFGGFMEFVATFFLLISVFLIVVGTMMFPAMVIHMSK